MNTLLPPDLDEREKMVLVYQSLKMWKKCPPTANIDIEFFINSGYFGILAAREKIDKTRPGWKAYLYRKVLSFQLDALRDQDPVPRLMRQRGTAPAHINVSSLEENKDGGKEQPWHPAVDDDEVLAKDTFWSSVLKGMSLREELMVKLYFIEGVKMKIIGETLDISESRVSQMMTGILLRLKSHPTVRETVKNHDFLQ